MLKVSHTCNVLDRQHAEVKKQCDSAKRSKEEVEQKHNELSQELAMIQVKSLLPSLQLYEHEWLSAA